MIRTKEIWEEQREMELSIEHELLHLEPTKSNIESAANKMVTAIKEGDIECFDVLVRMEAVKAFCDMVRKGAEQFTREELEKYGKEGYKALSAKFELAETGVKYSYHNDPVWSELNNKMETLKAEMKEQESLLKALTRPLQEVQDTGEVIERVPPSKTSNSSFKITLSK